jgi:hypothetical protein
MTDSEYEELTARLAEDLVQGAGDHPVRLQHGRQSHVSGGSGFPHQIDVAIWTASRLLVIECKCWRESIPVAQLLTFAARVYDIRAANPGIAVLASMATTTGYDGGCSILAPFFGIELDSVASEHEYALRYRNHQSLGLLTQQPLLMTRSPRTFYRSDRSMGLPSKCCCRARAFQRKA